MSHVPINLSRGLRQLFLDDIDIDTRHHLTRRMHRPQKKGAVIRPDLVAGGAPQIRTGPAWDPDEGLFKLWTLTATDGVMGHAGYHESRDGVHWTQPSLGQVEYQGSRDNHYVAFAYDEGSLGPNSVVYDADDPDPTRRYKAMAYYRPKHIMVLAVSPNGRDWRKLETGPLKSYDEFNLSLDRSEHRFIATVKVQGPYGRSHALTTSHDFETWSEPELIFHADEQDQDLARVVIGQRLANRTLQQPVSVGEAEWATDVYNFGVSRYESRYIGLAAFFYHTGRVPSGRNHDGFHHIQLAASRDMKTWQRLGDRQAFIGPSPLGAGAYDTMQLLPPSFPILRGDELWFYYTGIKNRLEPPVRDRDWSAVCLATLRRDGFVSLDGDVDGGWVTTRPLTWDGDTLYVNSDARAGTVACEVLDDTGHPLPGYSRADCTPLTTDSTRQAVTWHGSTPLPGSAGPLRLRFYVKQAYLYS